MLKDILAPPAFPWTAAVLLVLALVPFAAGRFYVYILAVIFVTGLLAMSLNLLVGHGGTYQFHHGVFYGVGAYTAGLIITKTALPAWVGFCAGPIAAAAAGLVIGTFCVRLNKLYFGMLQISLGSLIWILALRWYSLTNGDDGIHGIPHAGAAVRLGQRLLFHSHRRERLPRRDVPDPEIPLRTTLRAVRDNPQRCEAVGINVRRHQLLAIVIATFFAGVAGVLFVVIEGSVFPDMLFWVMSLEIFIMCLLGGWFTFFGPMLGAAIMVALRTFVGSYTEYWTLILGVVLILLIFFLPDGIMGINF